MIDYDKFLEESVLKAESRDDWLIVKRLSEAEDVSDEAASICLEMVWRDEMPTVSKALDLLRLMRVRIDTYILASLAAHLSNMFEGVDDQVVKDLRGVIGTEFVTGAVYGFVAGYRSALEEMVGTPSKNGHGGKE